LLNNTIVKGWVPKPLLYKGGCHVSQAGSKKIPRKKSAQKKEKKKNPQRKK